VIDLNADVGEGEDDLAIFPLVTSVNVACGAHAGDAETMERSVAAAARLGVALGAHPGYADREGFGRRALDLAPEALTRSLVDQIATLAALARRHGVRVGHVKPHGALYNQAAADAALAGVVAGAVRAAGTELRLVGLAGSAMLDAGRGAGLAVAAEAFADRGYTAGGTLAPRGTPGALVTDPALAAAQALAIARGEPIETVDGAAVTLAADTICLHADTPGAAANAAAVRAALRRAGIEIRALS
jgi:UPF0271 protein